MSKKPASTEELGGLHALVARVLGKQLSLADQALDPESELFKDLSTEQVDAIIAALGETKVAIGAAITFLKNNNITASVEKSAALRELEDELAKKRAGGKASLSPEALAEAAAAFERMQGGMVQ